MSRRLLLIALAALAALACARILGIKPPGRAPFPHREHVTRGISCLECHWGVDKAGDSSPLHIPDTKICVDCHYRPHDRRTCTDCHGREGALALAAQDRKFLRFSHEIHMPRVRGNCMRCHSAVATEGAILRPRMGNCLSCHEPREMFRTRECDACHVDLIEELVQPESHVVHVGDWLHEHGTRTAASSELCVSCHQQRFCLSCHGQTTVALPERLAFDDVTRSGVHRAGFRSRHSEEARGQPGLCTTCHSEDSCLSCHSARGISATSAQGLSPHRSGWLTGPGGINEHGRAAWRNPGECASCHGGAGEALCIGCHRVGAVGGNPHPPGWESRLSRTDLPCLLCHSGSI